MHTEVAVDFSLEFGVVDDEAAVGWVADVYHLGGSFLEEMEKSRLH